MLSGMRYQIVGIVLTMVAFGARPDEIESGKSEVLVLEYLTELTEKVEQSIHWSILKLAMEKSGRPYRAETIFFVHSPRRINQMVHDDTDKGTVLWRGTYPELEEYLLPVRVPIFRGLLSYWFIWIRQEEEHRFDDIDKPGALSKFSVIQGRAWSSIPIFEAAGSEVITGDYYNLPSMLSSGRGDILAYPVISTRALISGREKELGITFHKRIMIHMPHAMFYFVSPKYPALHDAIYDGLIQSFEDGSHEALIKSHPETVGLLDGFDFKNMSLLRLSDPSMTQQTRDALAKFSIDPAEFFDNPVVGGGSPLQ